ncbi:peroxisome- protein [Gaertneriomyces sp. JEL0708]|nr:peroxisome- protein [Gaertneriomyces sp. JEL0708]
MHRCGINTHKKCQHLVDTYCGRNRYDESVDDPHIYSDSEIDKGQLRHRPSAAAQHPRKPKRSFSEEKGISIVQELMTNTALNSHAMQKAAKDAQPPLNLFTRTPKNFTRFVSRAGALVAFEDSIVEILTWQNPPKTVVYMILYIFLSLHMAGVYPTLLLITPQMMIIYLAMDNYYHKTKKAVIGRKHSGNGNVQYLKNMQFIQNSMGMFCDLHDDIKKSAKSLDWSDEELTLWVLKMAVASMAGVLFVVKVVPLNYIMLVAGVSVLLHNTALFRAASTTLPPVLIKKLQNQVDNIREAIREARRKGDGSVVVVSLFENQRWWAGLGWIPHLLRSERGPWSDETGQIVRPPKEMYALPDDGVWEWVDEEWRLDVGWAEVDEHGWRYTDHVWQAGKRRAAMSSLTRRRMWVRKMRLVQPTAEVVATPASVVAHT